MATKNIYFGLKATIISLVITPDLSPGLWFVLKNRALAHKYLQ
jgi:hypothetical protein